MISVCMTCKKSFENFGHSPWCSTCEKDDQWAAPQNLWKEEKSQIEKRSDGSITKTPSSEQKRSREENVFELKILQKSESDTKPAKKNKTNSGSSGPERTESDSVSTTENYTTTTKKDSEPSSMPLAIRETPPEGLQMSYVDLNGEISRSMHSLNASENELLSSMKGLRSSQPDTAEKLYDPERVQTAIACAHQLVGLMKMKAELIRLSKEINE